MVRGSSQDKLRFSECASGDADISFVLQEARKQRRALSVNSGTPFLFEEVSQHRVCPYKAKPPVRKEGVGGSCKDC
jgi:hypothetical protein